jgi:ABC-type hemin transport system ATPase subunit
MKAASRVRALRNSLPPAYQWDERELALLDLAEQQARDLDALDRDIAENGVRVGETRLNSALMEARQARVALARVLGQIDIPEVGRTSSSHARNAAKARWAA